MITPDETMPERVLVVDDDPKARRLLATALRGHGVELLEARSGGEALEMAHRLRPSLILLDVTMPPGIDGFETCDRLKVDPLTRDITVIFMSSRRGFADKLRGLRAGAVDYIAKPLHADEVLARVQTHLTIRHLQTELTRRNDELARQNAALEEAGRQIRADLEGARRVQRALLPRSAPCTGGVGFAWRCDPCAALGGDALDVFPIDGRHIGFYLLDVTGHGVSAALLAVSVARFLTVRADRTSLVVEPGAGDGALQPVAPTDVMRRLNVAFPLEADRNPHLMTAIYGLLDSADGSVRYACAGHPHPLVVRAGGETEWLDGGSAPIGACPEMSYEEMNVRLGPRDRLFLYTDGLYEQANAAGEHFGLDRLVDAFTTPGTDLDGVIDAAIESVRTWSDSIDLGDDLSIVAIERRDPANGECR